MTEEIKHFNKLRFAKAFLNYWWIKDKAVEQGRLKTCRRLKVMDLTTLSSPNNDFEINERLKKIRDTTLKEHYNNIKHIVKQDSFFQNEEVVRNIDADPRSGRVRVIFTRDQTIKNYVIRVLETSSNLPLEQVNPHFILGDGPSSFSFSWQGSRRYYREGSHLEEDYNSIDDWLRRAKNTIRLVERVAPKMSDLERLYGFRHYGRSPAKIEFTGITPENCSVEDILKSAFVATGPNGTVRKQRGSKVTPKEVTPYRTRQEILNDYVSNVILQRGQ